MGCNDIFDAQSAPFALAASQQLGISPATTALVLLGKPPADSGFRFWNISPDAGQGMACLSSPDAYVSWEVQVNWRNKTHSMYYRTGPANCVYVPIYYGATVWAQYVNATGNSVQQWNGVLTADDPDPYLKGFFFKGMTQEPTAYIETCWNDVAESPTDTGYEVGLSLGNAVWPIANVRSCTVTSSNTAAVSSLNWAVGTEWARGLEGTQSNLNMSASIGPWDSVRIGAKTTATNATVVWSSMALASTEL